MDCVNHSGVTATAYCQNCGKALCATCLRNAAPGQILCEPCWTAWQSAQSPFPASPYTSQPNPAVAAALGIIPGVGAMYNGQFIKGLVHVFIFAILVSTAGRFPVFGLFIAGWIFYQVFEAYHVAKARRDGQPIPDPLGLNEIGNWLNFGARSQNPASPGGVPANAANAAQPGQQTGSSWQSPYQGPGPGYPNPGYPPVPPIPPIPPIPPVPPLYWRRKEPIGAVILIGLGLLFLMGQLDMFSGRAFEFAWPLMLIGLGVWMVVRHVQSSQGGPMQGGPK